MKEQFKHRLKAAMDFRQMKAVELCQRTNIPKSAMSYYLSGRSEPKADRIFLIAKELDVSEAWLLGYDVQMDRSKAQKENDELAELIQKLKKEEDFRSLVMRISKMESSQIEAIKSFLTAFPLK